MAFKFSLLVMVVVLMVGCGDGPAPIDAKVKERAKAHNHFDGTHSHGEMNDTLVVISAPAMQEDEFVDFVVARREAKDLVLRCLKVSRAPVLDGKDDDAVWAEAKEIRTLDLRSMREISLKAVHHDGVLYMYAKYPDRFESISHKTWVWDDKEGIYLAGNNREDVFVLKWGMEAGQEDLSFLGSAVGKYDVWFWKAARTNPSDVFDDKYHVVSEGEKDTLVLRGEGEDRVYLERKGDVGISAYESKTPYVRSNVYVKKYYGRVPTGSRGDITCKGVWRGGYWHLEFKRYLNTNHTDDDVVFKEGKSYLFGVSLYEMAGMRVPKTGVTQPLYQTGDVFDRLYLKIE